jgi:malonyl CoA-acyl carrier protein transacylase
MTNLCIFPGQGSQTPGMGKALFNRYPHLARNASDCLGYDIREKCLSAATTELAETRITQPLLYVVSALSYLSHVEDTGSVPEYLAGHSVGEYTALFAAGCFDFISGLEIVAERGQLMSEVSGGVMFAVLGLTPEEIVQHLNKLSYDQLTITNYNGYAQTVIAGYCDDTNKLQKNLFSAGADNVIQLKVSGCFHTHHMKSAAEKLASFLSRYRLSAPKIEVIANLTGRPYLKNDDVAAILVKQVYSPVLWLQSMEYILPKIDSWKEIGPGGVLTGIVSNIENTLKTEQQETQA